MCENNLTKACASLWEQCSKAMQNKVKACKDFLTVVKGDPMELLKAIKQHALNFQDTRCPMSIIHDAIKAVVNLKQKEGENLQECTKRFKTAKDVMVSHLGGHSFLQSMWRTCPNVMQVIQRKLRHADLKRSKPS